MLRALWSCGASDHLVLWIGDWSDLDAWMGLAGDLAESFAESFAESLAESLAGTLQGPCRGLEGHSESLGSRELGESRAWKIRGLREL